MSIHKKPSFQNRKRPRIGDVIEVPLPNGKLAYLQFINRDERPPCHGPLIRVLAGIFDKRPSSFVDLVIGPEQFMAFFPLGAACHRGLVTITGHEEVPERSRVFPIFKIYNQNRETKHRDWWLWDGVMTWRVGELPKECYDLPLREIIGLKVLEDRIMSGWKAADEVK